MQTRLEQLKDMEKQLATKLDELKEWREAPESKERIDEVLRVSDRISDLRSQPLYRTRSRDAQALREELVRQKIELQAISERAKTLPLFTNFGCFWQHCLVAFFVLLGLFILAKWWVYYRIYWYMMQLISIAYLILIICCIVFVASLRWRLAFDRNMVRLKIEVENLHDELVSLTDSLEEKSLEIEKALANHQKLVMPTPIKDGEVLLLKEKVSSLNAATNVAISQKAGEPFGFKICRPLVILIALVVITLIAICL